MKALSLPTQFTTMDKPVNVIKKPARGPVSFVGYTRVSTARQGSHGLSLAGQEGAIREYSIGLGIRLVEIRQDEASGAGAASNRPDLMDAFKTAAQEGSAIVITAVDRLGRSMSVLKHLQRHRIPVWVVGRGKLTRAQLRKELQAAQEVHREIQRYATEGHASRSKTSRTRTVPPSPEARRLGAVNGYLRAQDRDIRMFGFLGTHPELLALTHRELAKQLNLLGELNSVDRLNRPKEWTVKSAGNLRRRYHEELRVQHDLDMHDGIPELKLS